MDSPSTDPELQRPIPATPTVEPSSGVPSRIAPRLAALPNIVLDDAQAKFIAEDCGEHRIYFDGPTDLMQLMVAGSLRLKAGMTPHPPHMHPEEEFMLVTEGTGEIMVDGQVNQVRPGSMMYCAGGKYHAIVNTGATPMLFYYYKWLP